MNVGRKCVLVEPKEKGDYERLEWRRSSFCTLAQTYDLCSWYSGYWATFNGWVGIALLLSKKPIAWLHWRPLQPLPTTIAPGRSIRSRNWKEIKCNDVFFLWLRKKILLCSVPANLSFSLSLHSHILLQFTECFLLRVL